jgi:hypothetical protein
MEKGKTMTDREKLIQIIDSDRTYVASKESLADHLLANGVRLEPKQATSDENKRWIPVSERLPEVGTGEVLVARSYKGKPYVDVGEFINGTACCWGDEYAIKPREHITTHWMPLPEPPKEASNV